MTRRAWLLLAALLASCGYHLGGTGTDLPPGARTVSVSLFRNNTREAGLEVALRRAIEEEFRRRGPLDVVSESKGDLVLSGTIRRFQTTPVAFTGTSEAVQFQGIVQISFRLVERATGKVVYENQLLQESLDFGAVSDVVVTTSPRFQRNTVDARDLVQMTNVQIGEARRRETLGELVDLLARDVYLQSMEGF
jgi:outer membrane lipopolysaccharide assembly protein LptE/RlpB